MIFMLLDISSTKYLLGDGGTGKSYFISVFSKWAEKILIQSGDNPNRPKILLLAPTGKAASLIGKNTDTFLIL